MLLLSPLFAGYSSNNFGHSSIYPFLPFHHLLQIGELGYIRTCYLSGFKKRKKKKTNNNNTQCYFTEIHAIMQMLKVSARLTPCRSLFPKLLVELAAKFCILIFNSRLFVFLYFHVVNTVSTLYCIVNNNWLVSEPLKIGLLDQLVNFFSFLCANIKTL